MPQNTDAPRTPTPGKKQVILASIGLRCGAFLLDYILTLLVLAVTVLLAYFVKRRLNLNEGANIVLLIGYLATAAVLFLNLIYFAERTGQSFGKRFHESALVTHAASSSLHFRNIASVDFG